MRVLGAEHTVNDYKLVCQNLKKAYETYRDNKHKVVCPKDITDQMPEVQKAYADGAELAVSKVLDIFNKYKAANSVCSDVNLSPPS